MNDKRQHHRIDLADEGWRAVLSDQMNEKTIGEVVNLSRGGLMVLTGVALEPDSLYQIELRATGPNGQTESFEAGVMALWRIPAGRADVFWIGLEIIDISASDKECLLKITENCPSYPA
jgi:hypothetical protein